MTSLATRSVSIALGIAASACVSYFTFEAFALVHPDAVHTANLEWFVPLTVVPAPAAYVIAGVTGARRWPALRWAARVLLLLLALTAWRFWSFVGWPEALTWAGLAVAGIWLHQFAAAYTLGWITDHRSGERHRVRGLIRGHAIFSLESRTQRIVAEYEERRRRRGKLFWLGLITLPAAYLEYGRIAAREWGWVIGIGLYGSLAAVPWLWNLFLEIRYILGDQLIVGAKVLDLEPERPGLREVLEQHAHGDMTLASEAEAEHLLGGG
jgi:hypothetical protein